MMIPGSRTSLHFDRAWEDNVLKARRDGMPEIRAGRSAFLDRLAKLFFGAAAGSAETVVKPVPVFREAVQDVVDAVDAGVADIADAVDIENPVDPPKPGEA